MKQKPVCSISRLWLLKTRPSCPLCLLAGVNRDNQSINAQTLNIHVLQNKSGIGVRRADEYQIILCSSRISFHPTQTDPIHQDKNGYYVSPYRYFIKQAVKSARIAQYLMIQLFNKHTSVHLMCIVNHWIFVSNGPQLRRLFISGFGFFRRYFSPISLKENVLWQTRSMLFYCYCKWCNGYQNDFLVSHNPPVTTNACAPTIHYCSEMTFSTQF